LHQQVNSRIDSFLKSNSSLETPYVVVDTQEVQANLQRLQQALHFATPYYSVKANSADEVLRALIVGGSKFDAASMPEIRKCIALGIPAAEIHYGNTIKKNKHIREAHELGVRSYSFDSDMELEKLAEHAPGARVMARLATDGKGAAWPLSEKFGRSKQKTYELLVRAKELGLTPWGICFHVGSQQCIVSAWDKAIADSAEIVKKLAEQGIVLSSLNLGGGFPCRYTVDVPDIETLGTAIEQSLQRHGMNDLDIMLEPGRYLVSSSGVLVSEVVLVANNKDHAVSRWVYLDVGLYSGLCESGAINLPMLTDKDDDEMMPAVIAGPTCDSTDVLADKQPFELPKSLTCGDQVRMLGAGAYITSYATVNFNGFRPPTEYFIE